MFSKILMNAITPPQQLNRLMDDTMDTYSFQEINRTLAVQKEKVPEFGLVLDNPNLIKDTK